MRFMSFQWRAFSQDDLEEAFAKSGIEYDTFSYQFKNIHDDPYLYRNFKKVMSSKSYDAVFSWNYWPIIAQVCEDMSIPYIAWVYDCPISYRILPWATYKTSYVFIFDKAECEKYKKLGVNNAYHMPLAVNTSRIDGIIVNDSEREKLDCDISFLGTMYSAELDSYKPVLTDWENGFLEATIQSQGQFFGELLFDEVLDDKFLGDIMNRWNTSGVMSSDNLDSFRLWFTQLISKERTHRDRVGILNRLGEKHRTRYYSYSHSWDIVNAEFHKPLNYKEDMFKMFKSTKINLNITYRLITKGISLRVLDVMAAGGFLMSSVQEEMMENFEDGVDYVGFMNEDDVAEKARYYLEHEDERIKIAHNGHEAVKRFDYGVQLPKIINTVFG